MRNSSFRVYEWPISHRRSRSRKIAAGIRPLGMRGKMSIETLIAVRNGIGGLFIVMLIIIIFMYIRYWFVGYLEKEKK